MSQGQEYRDEDLPAEGSGRATPTFGLGGLVPSEGWRDRITGAEIVAFALSVFWLVLSSVFFLVAPAGTAEGFDSLRFAMVLLAIVLPVALIWVAAVAVKSARQVRIESDRLQMALDTMRHSYIADRQARGAGVTPVAATKRPAAAAAQPVPAQAALPQPAPPRPSPSQPAARQPAPSEIIQVHPEEQPGLGLDPMPADSVPTLPHADLIRALNFPDSEQDEAGFAALRRALADRQGRQMIQASQDVLTLLSQDGIYMDDLQPDRARPEIWRRFAMGERGRTVAALGGIHDRTCLAVAAGRMREDTIFRDAAHHFLRLFDRTLVRFEADASDEQIAALSETRTARAFMLLGRVTGTFD